MSDGSEAFEVGRSRGDDDTNYALAYGRRISDRPKEIPASYDKFRRDFERGWAQGVKDARQRDKALG